jgi:zinc transporter ZupT
MKQRVMGHNTMEGMAVAAEETIRIIEVADVDATTLAVMVEEALEGTSVPLMLAEAIWNPVRCHR